MMILELPLSQHYVGQMRISLAELEPHTPDTLAFPLLNRFLQLPCKALSLGHHRVLIDRKTFIPVLFTRKQATILLGRSLA